VSRAELVELLDQLCWSARRYGHDDNGIDGFAVDVDGNEVEDDESRGYYHPEAVTVADQILAMFGTH
jgi:hypothetical protein